MSHSPAPPINRLIVETADKQHHNWEHPFFPALRSWQLMLYQLINTDRVLVCRTCKDNDSSREALCCGYSAETWDHLRHKRTKKKRTT